MYKASINTLVKLATSVRDQNVLMNPHQEALSEIQKTKSRTVYVDFDVDSKNEGMISAVLKTLKEHFEEYKILETRGGYHILVEPSKAKTNKNWHTELSSFSDQAGDIMIPVPGCVQGEFVPHFINL
jgi:hypothetical protein